MAKIAATIDVEDLNDLLKVLKNSDVEISDSDMTSLPTFGGDKPKSTKEVWSWDEHDLIVGQCANDFRIVSRDEWFADAN